MIHFDVKKGVDVSCAACCCCWTWFEPVKWRPNTPIRSAIYSRQYFLSQNLIKTEAYLTCNALQIDNHSKNWRKTASKNLQFSTQLNSLTKKKLDVRTIPQSVYCSVDQTESLQCPFPRLLSIISAHGAFTPCAPTTLRHSMT